ncbi:MAG: hypothetical protein U9Q70_03030 [Chloroflexota bacterium]|nr:hypothetical protein [Chloroflexota bacterium]
MRIRTLVMDETLDAAILKVLVEKAARIRRDYGFSPPYFGDETTILDLLRQHNVKLGPKQLTLFGSRSKRDGASVDPFAEESLERIKGDSFYGQTNISLSEIEERLEETAQTVGSPEEIRRFVFSGLDRFGCSRTKNADGSYRIALTLPALQTAAMGAVIERATFNPEWALDDPDMTLLLADAVETRWQALAAERRRLREQMEIHKTSQPAEWLDGIDDLAPGSFDLLMMTVLFPA